MQTWALHGRVVGTLKIPVDCVWHRDTEVPLIDRQLFLPSICLGLQITCVLKEQKNKRK
jgi:hypothetical protein